MSRRPDMLQGMKTQDADYPLQPQRFVQALVSKMPDPNDASGFELMEIMNYNITAWTVDARSDVTQATITGIPCLNQCALKVGLGVWVAKIGNALLGVGTVGDPRIGPMSGLSAFSSGGGTNGNGTFDNCYYVLENRRCTYWGHFTIGSTTVWNAGVVVIWLPVNTASVMTFTDLGEAGAYDNSRGENWRGVPFMPGTGTQSGMYVFGSGFVGGNTMRNWAVQASPNAFPFGAGDAWALADEIRWFIEYPI